MSADFSHEQITSNLELLSDWLRVKSPAERFELVVVGGAALVLMGHKDQTRDIDIIKPYPLPSLLQQGTREVARARKLSSSWLSDSVARVFAFGPHQSLSDLPEYFRETWESFEISENLVLKVIGRQALITMKLYACNPSVEKHLEDLRALRPGKGELKVAVDFCLKKDPHHSTKEDIEAIICKLEFDPDEIF